MKGETREAELFDAFVALADTLVAGFDVVDLFQMLVDTCQSALGVAHAGLLIANSDGDLELVASTSEQARLVETIQLAAEAGPCVESFRTGAIVSVEDVSAERPRWPAFIESAIEQGFRSVTAIPLRLRDDVIGTLNLLDTDRGPLDSRTATAAQALADVATIGVLHERSFRASDVLRRQLQHALDSRIVIEQAKGVLAQTHRTTPEEAFVLLRNHARSNRQPLVDIARQLVDRTLIF